MSNQPETLSPEQPKKCECKFCQFSRKVQAVQAKLSPEDAAIITEAMCQLVDAKDDAGYWQSKYNGTWPGETDRLRSACEEARRAERQRCELAIKVAEEATFLILRQGYDGPCMGEEIGPLMDAMIAYDAACWAIESGEER